MASFKEFMAARLEAAEAYVAGDAGPLLEMSTRTEPASFFAPDGRIVLGAGDVVSTNEAGAGHFGRGSETHLEILHVGSDHGIGYWVGIQHANMLIDGGHEPVSMHLRITELFRRESGEWKLIHRHADQLTEVPR